MSNMFVACIPANMLPVLPVQRKKRSSGDIDSSHCKAHVYAQHSGDILTIKSLPKALLKSQQENAKLSWPVLAWNQLIAVLRKPGRGGVSAEVKKRRLSPSMMIQKKR